jgi:hypothetical protein
MIRSRLVVALLILAPAALAGQIPPSVERPEAVVEAYYRAITDGRWLDAVRLADLKAFDESRKSTIESLRRPQPEPHFTVSQLLEAQPDMPRVVAEYQVKQVNAASHRFNLLDYEYARIPNVDSLAAMPVEEAAARWLEAKDPRWQLTRALHDGRLNGCPIPPEEESSLRGALVPLPPRIIGAIIEDSLAYVVLEPRQFDPSSVGRAKADSSARRSEHPSWIGMPPRIATLHRGAGRWLIEMDEGREGGFGLASIGCGRGSTRARGKR